MKICLCQVRGTRKLVNLGEMVGIGVDTPAHRTDRKFDLIFWAPFEHGDGGGIAGLRFLYLARILKLNAICPIRSLNLEPINAPPLRG